MPLYFVTGMDHIIITQIAPPCIFYYLEYRKTNAVKKSQNKHFPAKRTGAAFPLSPMRVCVCEIRTVNAKLRRFIEHQQKYLEKMTGD